jgi:hypothetical protein
MNLPRHGSRAVAVAAGLLAACAGPGRPGPEALGYQRPDPNPATYTFADTAALSVETQMGPMSALTGLSGTAELDFRARDHAFQVYVRFPDLRGTFRAPGQDPAVVDGSAVDGHFTVRVASTGFAAITESPKLGGALPDIIGPESLVRGLFVHLPGRPVGVGAQWVDSMTVTEEVGETRSVSRTLITSILEGDTVMAGRRLLRIRTEAITQVTLAGVSGGVEVEQDLSGTVTGLVLWDHQAGLLFRRTEAGTLSGTLTLPGVADPMPVQVDVSHSVVLGR